MLYSPTKNADMIFQKTQYSNLINCTSWNDSYRANKWF